MNDVELNQLRENAYRDMLSDDNLYRDAIRSMIAKKSSEIFPNASYSHASIVLTELVRASMFNVSIFCRCMSQDVYGNRGLVDAIADAVSRGVNVRFLLQQDTPQAETVIGIFDNPSHHIHVIKKEEDKNKPNFSVVDSKMFRYERDKIARKAVVCVNSRTATPKILEKWFDKVFSSKELSSEVVLKRSFKCSCAAQA